MSIKLAKLSKIIARKRPQKIVNLSRGEKMKLGNNLFQARKKSGLSQEAVAEKLGVSRQTISKWETDETIPDIYQSKKLSTLYSLTLDELLNFDVDLKEIEDTIKNYDDKKDLKIDWTKAWSKKYPILSTYKDRIDISLYECEIKRMLDDLKKRYGLDKLDSMLALKDILYCTWKSE